MSYIQDYVANAATKGTLKNLKKFNAKFGVELEFVSPIDLRRFRDNLAATLGSSRVHPEAGGYGSRTGRYDTWQVTTDSSICGTGYGIELISPVLSATSSDDFTQLDKVFTLLHELGCKTNASTGMHISVSCLGLTETKFKPLVFCALTDDLRLVKHFKRQNNRYCQPYTKKIIDQYRSSFRSGDVHKLISSSSSGSLSFGKYCSVNTGKLNRSSPIIEYRGVGGNYLTVLRPADVVGIARRLCSSLIASVHSTKDHEDLFTYSSAYFVKQFVLDNQSRLASDRTYKGRLSDSATPLMFRVNLDAPGSPGFRFSSLSNQYSSFTTLARRLIDLDQAGTRDGFVALASSFVQTLTERSLRRHIGVLFESDYGLRTRTSVYTTEDIRHVYTALRDITKTELFQEIQRRLAA